MTETDTERNPYAVSETSLSAPAVPGSKVFGLIGLMWAGIVGGPIIMTLLMLFDAGRLNGAKMQWKVGLTFVPVIIACFFIFEVYWADSRPSQLLMQLLLVCVGWGTALAYLGSSFKAHRKSGGLFYSRWLAVLIAASFTGVWAASFWAVPRLVNYVAGT